MLSFTHPLEPGLLSDQPQLSRKLSAAASMNSAENAREVDAPDHSAILIARGSTMFTPSHAEGQVCAHL